VGDICGGVLERNLWLRETAGYSACDFNKSHFNTKGNSDYINFGTRDENTANEIESMFYSCIVSDYGTLPKS
jgi:hypothetical protein